MEGFFGLILLGIIFFGIPWLLVKLDHASKYIELKNRYGEIDKAEAVLQAREITISKQQQAVQTKTQEAELKIARQQQAIECLQKEKATGFPWLAKAYDEFYELVDEKYAEEISSKRHGKRAAPASGEKVREANQSRRVAEKEARVLRYQLLFYENLFPWLLELKDPAIPDELIRIKSGELDAGNSEDDPAKHWIPVGEWDSYSEIQRLQLALDRYWRSRKTKWEIGRDYERYIGYLYEQKGYSVHYHGIAKGFDDLGRDLICSKGNEVWIVQCKNWAREKQIHEKHIFQLHGTLIAYQHDNPAQKSQAHFITSALITARAKEFAKILGIKIDENFLFQNYPCIKCNVSHRDETKIFHLPFDQQYDRTTIDITRGEKYCSTVAEALENGFRRAFKYRGD